MDVGMYMFTILLLPFVVLFSLSFFLFLSPVV